MTDGVETSRSDELRQVVLPGTLHPGEPWEVAVTDVAKKAVVFLVIAFAAFYLISQPEGAADAVRGAIDAVAAAFDAVIRFFGALAE